MNCQLSPGLTVILMLGLTGAACQRQEQNTPDAGSKVGKAAASVAVVPLTNMVLVKAGGFQRGKHWVTLTRDYWLGKYEVTQRDYLAVIGNNPSHFTNDMDCPVEKVRFTEAAAFCAALTEQERRAQRLPLDFEYRLPTEAEWEYACRAGTTNLYSFGADPSLADRYAWTMENSDGRTHPVGQKSPNPWGFHDMHGNVWEWCSDWFARFPPADVRDPLGPPGGKYKVFRGGGWNNTLEMARCGNRFMMVATNGIYFVGFRLALGPIKR